MSDELDWEQFGRQLALPELGPEGQRHLARQPVALDLNPAVSALAATLSRKLGGVVDPGSSVRVTDQEEPRCAAEAQGAAAFWALEGARRALGWEPRELPPALRARLRPRERTDV